MSDDTIISISWVERIFYDTYFEEYWEQHYTRRVKLELEGESLTKWTLHSILKELKRYAFPRNTITYGELCNVIETYQKLMLEYAGYNETNRSMFFVIAGTCENVIDLIHCYT